MGDTESESGYYQFDGQLSSLKGGYLSCDAPRDQATCEKVSAK